MEDEEPIQLTFLKHPIVWMVTIARLLIALYIFINPLWGVIWSMVADWVDSQVLIHGIGVTRPQYQLWDKNVDWFAYVVELSVAASYGLYLPFFLLLFWRFLGQFMFLKTHKRWMFVFFPNFFEIAFLWLILFYPQQTMQVRITGNAGMWLFLLIVAKEINEIGLHFLLPKHPEWETGNRAKRFYHWLFRNSQRLSS